MRSKLRFSLYNRIEQIFFFFYSCNSSYSFLPYIYDRVFIQCAQAARENSALLRQPSDSARESAANSQDTESEVATELDIQSETSNDSNAVSS